ncbi:MAG TPA: hypothetical protein EYQ25_11605 [Planctomycetes bacterium]|nr:hypothetical protein [Planctomycetota bacterium]HIL38729.1 hypothetical protein [Planctomycetota bacterium]
MKNTSLALGLAGLTLVCSAFNFNSGSRALENVKVGDQIDKTFSKAPADSFGVKSFKDLRGTPILVEFWGTR